METKGYFFALYLDDICCLKAAFLSDSDIIERTKWKQICFNVRHCDENFTQKKKLNWNFVIVLCEKLYSFLVILYCVFV